MTPLGPKRNRKQIRIQRAKRAHLPFQRTWKTIVYCSHYCDAVGILPTLNSSVRWVYRIHPSSEQPTPHTLAQELSS